MELRWTGFLVTNVRMVVKWTGFNFYEEQIYESGPQFCLQLRWRSWSHRARCTGQRAFPSVRGLGRRFIFRWCSVCARSIWLYLPFRKWIFLGNKNICMCRFWPWRWRSARDLRIRSEEIACIARQKEEGVDYVVTKSNRLV